ncbi:MAG: transposase [Opitutaceae bacterium]|nr:transposase [Opitutaceae bacterium]
MRTPRIKVDPRHSGAVYHCMSRTVNSERCLDDTAREMFRKQLWQIADYCGVQILTYAVMSNHFHVLVRVPLRVGIADAELLRRYHVLYPKPTKYQAAHIEDIAAQLKKGGPDADAWCKQQLALMGEVSQFMKLLKQRFSIWFNRTHNRHGTLWSERFKSVLVEGRGYVLSTMAAYIDLNPVRAGIVDDPKDYRFCGYAEAVAGKRAAQSGITAVVGDENNQTWRGVHDAYRMRLFGAGVPLRADKAAISQEAFEKVIAENGTLPLATVLRCRVRYFSDGAVLGSKAFVAKYLTVYKRQTGHRKRTTLRPLPKITDWGDLVTLRGLRKKAFG